jgi:hypothetical protein
VVRVAARRRLPRGARGRLMFEDLAEWQLRLLRSEQVTQALEDIYGPGGTVLQVVSTHAKTDGTIERVARYRVRESWRVVFVGCSKMYVEPLRAELGDQWDAFLADLEAGRSLTWVLRTALGARVRSVDRGLRLVDPARHARERELAEWFEDRGMPIVERSRRIVAAGDRVLVDLDEYFAIEAG